MARVETAPIQVQKYLKGMNYPASKEDLINQAKKNRATEDVISMLEQIKSNKFNTPAEVSKALGGSGHFRIVHG
ncbi:MAG TPA: DUF2795 domain-containing protein [Bacteroidales bacterium]|nr:DUF2795 domain-containing protein [Bacteroidales bacterium]